MEQKYQKNTSPASGEGFGMKEEQPQHHRHFIRVCQGFPGHPFPGKGQDLPLSFEEGHQKALPKRTIWGHRSHNNHCIIHQLLVKAQLKPSFQYQTVMKRQSHHIWEKGLCHADLRESREPPGILLNLFYEVLSLQDFQSGCLARKENPGMAWALVSCGAVTISTASPQPGNPGAQQGVEFGIVSEVLALCLALLPPAGLGIAVNFILF